MPIDFAQLDTAAGPLWPTFRDDPTCAAARNALALVYLPMAEAAAASEAKSPSRIRHRTLSASDHEDLEQLAFFCLLDLLHSYDASRNGGSFVKYASHLMRLRIKAASRQLSEITRAQVAQGVEREEMKEHHVQTIPDTSHGADHTLPAELHDFREWLMSELSPRLARIFELRFMAGFTNAQTGAEIGLCETSVSKIVSGQLLPQLARLLAPGHAPRDAERKLRDLVCYPARRCA